MIPVLYEAGETAFASNGLGRLGEATGCTVEEERNGKYELELQYPVEGDHFSDIKHSCIIFAKPSDGTDPQPFRIYYISKPIGGIITVKAEHISYQLSHIPVSPFASTACADALLGLKNNAAEACPFTFWTDKTSAGNFAVTEPSSIRSRLGGVRGSILDVYGGEYEFDRYTVKLHSTRGSNRGVALRYGKNITDIRQEENIESTVTGVYPYWKNGEDAQTLVELPEKVLHSTNAANFPFQRTVPLDLSEEFQEEPTEAQLRQRATSYMTENGIGVPSVSIKVEFIPLWQTEEYKDAANLERVRLCDTVSVEFPALDISASAKVVRTKYDVLKERYLEIELGDAKSSLGATLANSIASASGEALKAVRETSSALKKEIERNTARITGADGGSVQFLFDANGNPTAIVALNTDSVDTATECLVLNYAGLGGSQNGVAGPFITAITSDGHINADMITVGHLLATLIRGGVLALGGTESDSSFGNGVLKVYDSNDLEIGSWGVNGIEVRKGTIQGPAIVVGGNNNDNGTITVKDASGSVIGTWDKDGLNATGVLSMVSDTTFATVGKTQTYVVHYVEGLVTRTLENFQYTIPDGNKVRAIKSFVKADTNDIQEIYATIGTEAKRAIYLTTGSYVPGLGDDKTSSILGSVGGFEEEVSYSSATGLQYRLHVVGWRFSSNAQLIMNDTGCAMSAGGKTVSPSRLYDGTHELTWNTGYINNSSFPYGTLRFDGNRVEFQSSSSRRYKHGIKPIDDAALNPHRLLDLPIVQFEWNEDHLLQYEDMRGKTIPGIIAEDVEEIYPSATIHGENGEVESWDERRIIPGMLALIQEQEKQIRDLKSRLKELEAKLHV